jgi:biotin carboxyl carrier protein
LLRTWNLDGHAHGEFVSIRERIVVAPHWGRIHVEARDQKRRLDEGVILGRLLEGARETLLVAPVRAVLIRWMVREGERVAPGDPIVLLLSLDGNE